MNSITRDEVMVSRFERITAPVHEFFGYPDDGIDVDDVLEVHPPAVHGVSHNLEADSNASALLEANSCDLRFCEPRDVGIRECGFEGVAMQTQVLAVEGRLAHLRTLDDLSGDTGVGEVGVFGPYDIG